VVDWPLVAETKTRLDTPNADQAAPAAEAKAPGRRRITKRKAVEAHVRGLVDAISRRDLAAYAEHWAEDGVEDMVPVGVLRGREALVRNLADLFAAVPDLETTLVRLIPGEREALAEMRMQGTFNGAAFQGIEPTGKQIEIRLCEVFEIEGGKVAGSTTYYDGASFARQVGMLPPQDSGAERAMLGAFNTVTKLRRTIDERRKG
jgi:steroid delta-isomerase-like uncharacterized protein